MPERIWYLLSLKLSGEATQAELDEFHGLLEQQPEWEEAVQHLTRYWLQESPPPASAESLWARHLYRMENAGIEWAGADLQEATPAENQEAVIRPMHRKRWWLAAAAVLVLGLSVAAFRIIGYHPGSDHQQLLASAKRNEIVTRPASRTQLILPDGSKVWLNASSKLTYGNGFGEDNRNIWLEGEGFFEVYKNKALPFIIHTSRMDIRVTGTVFNVRAYPQETSSETALIEGAVEVALPGETDWKYHLRPRQKLVVDENGVAATETEPSPKGKSHAPVQPVPAYTASLQSLARPLPDNQVVETAWVYSLLSFSDESFRQVANKLEKWYGVSIRFAQADMENWRFTGSFRNESLAEALTALRLSTPFRFVIEDKNVIISKPDTK